MRVLVVHAHPDPDSFNTALRDRVSSTLRGRGHQVDVLDLHGEGFDPCLGLDAWRQVAAPSPGLERHHGLLQAADALVLVYPTWWGGQPAMLKGWLDRTFVEGVAYLHPEGANRIRARLLNIRRVAVVTTHGSSKLVNMMQGEPGKRTIFRGIRVLFNPLCRTTWLAYYGMDRATPEDRNGFADRVQRAFEEW